MSSWDKLFAAFQSQSPVDATVVKKVKGGYVVDVGCDAFLPGSQLDLRPAHDPEAWLQKKISVVITEMDRAKSNVVVSRRKLLEKDRARSRESTLSNLTEGQTVSGTVTNITSFGAFVDIGGVEGLSVESAVKAGHVASEIGVEEVPVRLRVVHLLGPVLAAAHGFVRAPKRLHEEREEHKQHHEGHEAEAPLIAQDRFHGRILTPDRGKF
jgi:DNA-directed RNA polymerase subunit E'/Rpb7